MLASSPKPEEHPRSRLRSLFRSPAQQNFLICLLLVFATLALYNRAGQNGFVNFDDDLYILGNPHVQAGLHWETVKWALHTYDFANWHPLTWYSHALDCQLFGLNPAGHHYTNLLLHAANVVLLFLVFQAATGFAWRSLMVAALFAFHPLNVESVAWVAERKNVLSMFFLLLALWTYQKYVRHPAAGLYFSVMLWFACGLMSKPQVITFPFLLLLWDYWPLKRTPAADRSFSSPPPASVIPPASSYWWLIREKLPFFLLSAISALVTVQAQKAGRAMRSAADYSMRVRIDNAIVAYFRYVGKCFWPAHLAPLYPLSADPPPFWQVLAAALFLLLVTGLVFTFRRQRYLVVGWLWFLGTLVPMIGLVQVGRQSMADRYAYLPVIGLFLIIVWGASQAIGRLRLPPTWLAAPAVLMVLALGGLTYQQIKYWHDSETLWTHSLQVTGQNFDAEYDLARYLAQQGRAEETIVHFRKVVAMATNDPRMHLYLGTYEKAHGHAQEAVEQLQAVIRMPADTTMKAEAYTYLGETYRQLGDDAESKENYMAALTLDPDKGIARIGLGLLAQKNGNLAAAAQQYARAVSTQPSDVGCLLLAQALEKSGHAAEGKRAYEQARQISPDLSGAEATVASLLAN
jgi:tetratricopeptide (TPR) repeat protein